MKKMAQAMGSLKVSGVRCQELYMNDKTYLAVEDLDVYRRLCKLHLDVCDLTHEWPTEERYELGSQARRASNSSPSQLAEKNDDRHVRNKIEGVNRARGEAGETIHHLYMARLKEYIPEDTFKTYRTRHKECIRMLNGLEKTLERKLPASDRRWRVEEEREDYGSETEFAGPGWPDSDEADLTPET